VCFAGGYFRDEVWICGWLEEKIDIDVLGACLVRVYFPGLERVKDSTAAPYASKLEIGVRAIVNPNMCCEFEFRSE